MSDAPDQSPEPIDILAPDADDADDAGATDALIGQTLGERYHVLKRLSQGGMGVVYLARHIVLDSLFAVKVLLKPQNEHDQQRFLQEARLASKISHPNTVYIADFGVLPGGRTYLAMEYLEGDTLAEVLQRGKLEPLRACRIAAQIARGLTAVHEKGVIHRDLKPSNIFLLSQAGKQDFVKIVDFGIAKANTSDVPAPPGADARPKPVPPPPLALPAALSMPSTPPTLSPPPVPPGPGLVTTGADLTVQGAILGTPAYLSPEQGKGRGIDARTDQYSLGCIFFEMLTGERPYHGDNSIEVIMKHIGAPIPSPRGRGARVSERLDALCRRLLAKRADARFAAMPDVAAALELEIERLTRRRLPRWVVGGGIALGAVLLGLSALTVSRGLRGGDARPVPLSPAELAETRAQALAALGAAARGGDPLHRLHGIAGLGSSQDSAARPLLETLLAGADESVAAQAAEALGALGDGAAAPALLRALAPARPAALRLSAARALLLLGDETGEQALTRALAEGDEASRLQAALLLCDRGQPAALALLRRVVARPDAPAPLATSALACLARGPEGLDARQELVTRLQRASTPAAQLQLAAVLAGLGEPAGREQLRAIAARPGRDQLLAARALASPDELEVAARFRRVLRDGAAGTPAQILSAEGLGVGGELTDLRLLRPYLAASADPALRLAAASSIVQLALSDAGALSQQSLRWAQLALSERGAATRAAAAAALGDTSSPDALRLLARLLRDDAVQVRKSSARALGQKADRAALLALREALSDPDEQVRIEAIRSLGRAALGLHDSGAADPREELAGWFKELLPRATQSEQVQVSWALYRLGNEGQLATLAGLLRDPRPELRRYVIAQTELDADLLVTALGDADQGVRFAAAQKLAERGDRRALAVLRDTVVRSGPAAIAAYGLLGRLGEKAEPPAALAALLSPSTPVPARMEAIEAVGRMPTALAVPLLLQAARAPEALVRRLVAEVAAELPGSEGPSGAHVLRLLTLDADPGVRARAATLLTRIQERDQSAGRTAPPGPRAPAVGPQAPPDAGPGPGLRDLAVAPADAALPGGDSPAEPRPAGTAQAAAPASVSTGRGTLQLTAPEGILYEIDRRGWQVTGGKPVSLPAGTHRLATLSGEQDVLIEDRRTTTVALEPSPPEQALSAGVSAYGSRDLGRAQQQIERAASLCARDRRHAAGCALLGIELALRRGHLLEDQKYLAEAMAEYQKVAESGPAAKVRPLQRLDAQESVARLAPRLGQVVLLRKDRKAPARCVEDVIWLLPGTQSVKVGAERQTIYVRARETVRLGTCP